MGRKFKFGRRRSDWWKRLLGQSFGTVRYLRRREAVLGLLLLAGTATIYWQWDLGNVFQRSRLPSGVSVINGNRLVIGGTEYRLYGIDAPDDEQTCRDRFGRRWKCGRVAAHALKTKIREGASDVRCTKHGTDQHGYIFGICHQSEINLNDWMVREGHAVAYRLFSSTYIAAEEEARQKIKGLWAGSFVRPEEWRQGKRL